jgi:hypothetical protein
MSTVEGVIRACPQCGGEAFRALPDYSSPPWQILECGACGFVFLRNPPEYKYLVSEFAWEKMRVAEVARRKARSPIRMRLDGMTRWRTGIYSPGIAGRLKRLFAPGRVPGGSIYVRVPNCGSLNRRMLGAKWCGFRYPDHVNYFTTASLGAMVGDCGLRLKLLNPIRLPLDDNMNAVLLSEAGRG